MNFVRVRDCACPGAPHREPRAYPGIDEPVDGDLVFLSDKASLPLGLAIRADRNRVMGRYAEGEIDKTEISGELSSSWMVDYVKFGTTGWNLLDEIGDPVPFDRRVLVDDFELGNPVAERLDDLFGAIVIGPLLPKRRKPSQRGLTETSTQPTRESIPSPSGSSSQSMDGSDSTPSIG